MGCLDGLKTISMAWIVLCHGFLGLYTVPITNYVYVLDLLDYSYIMILISGTLAVDTFFVVSGFLMSYNVMKIASRGGKINVPMLILHRFLRLTPAFAVVILAHATLFEYFGSGPVYPKVKEEFMEDCQVYWWSALLYIQNFVNPRDPVSDSITL